MNEMRDFVWNSFFIILFVQPAPAAHSSQEEQHYISLLLLLDPASPDYVTQHVM
jgi:hypothetical protein